MRVPPVDSLRKEFCRRVGNAYDSLEHLLRDGREMHGWGATDMNKSKHNGRSSLQGATTEGLLRSLREKIERNSGMKAGDLRVCELAVELACQGPAAEPEKWECGLHA